MGLHLVYAIFKCYSLYQKPHIIRTNEPEKTILQEKVTDRKKKAKRADKSLDGSVDKSNPVVDVY